MELTKDIKYDKNLKQNECVKIDYSGCLYENGSHEVYIVYGFDKDWKNTTYQKMDKLENCFSTSVQLLEYNDFNFCFKDSNDNWDNNNYSDYTLKIEEKSNLTTNLNSLLDDILNETKTKNESNSLEESISKIQKIADSFDEIFEDSEVVNSNLDNNQIQQFDSLLNEIETEVKISDTASAECLDLEKTFPQEFDFVINTENAEITENTILSVQTQAEVESTTETATTSESPSLALTTTSKNKNIFDFENLSPWYILKKRIRLAFYKFLYILPAFLFGEDED